MKKISKTHVITIILIFAIVFGGVFGAQVQQAQAGFWYDSLACLGIGVATGGVGTALCAGAALLGYGPSSIVGKFILDKADKVVQSVILFITNFILYFLSAILRFLGLLMDILLRWTADIPSAIQSSWCILRNFLN